MKMLKLAWRNIRHNIRRSLITVTAITVGLAALIFVWGYVDGMNDQSIENTTRYVTGHIKIHKTGFHEDKKLHLSMADTSINADALLGHPNIEAVTPRVEGKALISSDEKSHGVVVVGVDPKREPLVTTISQSIVAGTYLDTAESNTIVLGDKLAKVLEVGIADSVVLITQARDGSVGADRYRVQGIFDSGINVLDGSNVFIPLTAAQDLYSLWGQVTAWVVSLDNRLLAGQVSQELADQLGADFEVLDWRKLLPSVVQMMAFHEVIAYVVLLVVFMVVAIGIANTILMAVMKRTREFGVMMALGTSRRQILTLVVGESLLLGILGLMAGNLFGLGITAYYAQKGMNLGQYTQAMETMPGLSGIVYPLLRLDHVLLVSFTIFLISLLPAIYPAWRASRVTPVEAMRGTQIAPKLTGWLRGATVKRKPAAALLRGSLFWRITVRGIGRNPRRSLLTCATTAFGLTAFLFMYAFADDFFDQMVRNSTGYLTAHMQIEHSGFRDELDPGLTIDIPDTLLNRIRQDPRVAGTAPRVQVKAMISSPTKSENILLYGVDPSVEPQVTILHRTVRQGQYLEPGSASEILMGRKLLDKLRIRLGEKVVITAQLADSNLTSAAYRVVGVFETGSIVFDEGLAFVHLNAAQELMGFGERISTIAVSLKDRERAGVMAAQLQGELTDTPYNALTWETVMPVVVQMIDLTKVNFYVMLAIIFLVVAIGIMNTLLMSVFERTREFGVQLALGTRPSQIMRIVIYEALLLGLAGIAAGYVMGGLLVRYYGSYGIDLSIYTKSFQAVPGMTDVIYPQLILSHVLVPSLLLLVAGITASLYPAWRAAHQSPVEAMRHV